MTSQSRCSRDDSFLATGTGLREKGDNVLINSLKNTGVFIMRHADVLIFSYHIQQVDSSFKGASRSGAGGFLPLLQHPPPVPCAVLLTRGSCCRGLRSREHKKNED